MMYETYFDAVMRLEQEIAKDEAEHIKEAAVLMADTIRDGGMIHVFGCGHSHMMAEEAFYRAGGLVPVNPILDTAVMLHEGGVKSSSVERMEHYAPLVLDRYEVREGDMIFIYSTSGINGCSIDMALYAKEKKMKVVAVTSLNYSTEQSRHSLGLRLSQCADLVINNHVPYGDALVELPEQKGRIAPGSTVLCALIWNMVISQLAEELIKHGVTPEYYTSGNVKGGREKNQQYIEAYRGRIKAL